MRLLRLRSNASASSFLGPGGLAGRRKSRVRGCTPRFDAKLQCPGDIGNNIGALELQSSKCLSEAPIPRSMWPPGARTPKVEGGGVSLLKNPKAIHLYVYGPLGAKKKQGSGLRPEILTPYCHAQGISATT